MNVVLTGSSSGIGLALAERLLARGHRVWGLARSDQSDAVARNNGAFAATRCDMSRWKAVSEAAAGVGSAWTHVDALVTCAGIQGEIGRAVTADPENWARTVAANLNATFFAIRAFHQMLGRAPGRAKIVCFSGGGASKSRPNFSAYAAAKTAIVRLVETVAEEEGASRMDINALAPGAINTRLTDEVIALGPSVVGNAEFEAARKQKEGGGASLQRTLDVVEWLVSPASDGLSGRFLSAPWDPIERLPSLLAAAAAAEIYKLRRLVPGDRGLDW